MNENLVALRLLTNAVIAALEEVGPPVGDGQAPGKVEAAPYYVVHPLIVTASDGTLANPDEDARVYYQINSVGKSREQTEGLADAARAVMLSGSLTVSGQNITRVSQEVSVGVERDDDVTPPVFYSRDRFLILTTPTSEEEG